MTPDLYTDEFRNFKYLKSTSAQIEYYKGKRHTVNSVQEGPERNDPDFVWPCRLEFLEQLLDLDGETVYLVEPGPMVTSALNGEFDYENAVCHTIQKSVVCIGHPLMFKSPARATIADIPKMEDNGKNNMFFLCTKESLDNAIKLHYTGLIPLDGTNFAAVFYDKDTAEQYRKALTSYLRKRNDAVSAIVRSIF